MQATTVEEVIIERRGSAGIIRLNRQKALNSLTLPMVEAIAAALTRFAADAAVATVIIAGEGERGFCAGGDIRALHHSGRNGTPEAEAFWRAEFHLNRMISAYPKPYVALMDGITMGGGVGLSAHGSHRVVTERTRLAMPETGIGYFPDVGATWLLPRAPGEIGTFMGLSGLTVTAADAIHAGLADHQLASADLPALVEALAALAPAEKSADVEAVIASLAQPSAEGPLAAHADDIAHAFAHDTVEAILETLAAMPGAFASETLEVLATRSPTSLKLTLALLRAGGRSASLAECLEREFGACLHILKGHDFYEGVRAAVIDKDRNPQWSPSLLGDVGSAAIERFLVAARPPLFQHQDEKETQS